MSYTHICIRAQSPDGALRKHKAACNRLEDMLRRRNAVHLDWFIGDEYLDIDIDTNDAYQLTPQDFVKDCIPYLRQMSVKEFMLHTRDEDAFEEYRELYLLHDGGDIDIVKEIVVKAFENTRLGHLLSVIHLLTEDDWQEINPIVKSAAVAQKLERKKK